MSDKTKWLEDIKAYAISNYYNGGYDVLVECWDDNAYLETMEGFTSYNEFKDYIDDIVGVFRDRQLDVINSAF